MNQPVYANEISADLAKRLAEAADGLRDSKFYYLICKLNFPFELVHTQGHSTATAANSAADALLIQKGMGYQKFGPYNTPREQGYTPLQGFDQIKIAFMNGTQVIHDEVVNKDTDTVVLTLEAYDKFILPYYTKLYGAERAGELRSGAKQILSGNLAFGSPIHMICHSDGTSSTGSTT